MSRRTQTRQTVHKEVDRKMKADAKRQQRLVRRQEKRRDRVEAEETQR